MQQVRDRADVQADIAAVQSERRELPARIERAKVAEKAAEAALAAALRRAGELGAAVVDATRRIEAAVAASAARSGQTSTFDPATQRAEGKAYEVLELARDAALKEALAHRDEESAARIVQNRAIHARQDLERRQLQLDTLLPKLEREAERLA